MKQVVIETRGNIDVKNEKHQMHAFRLVLCYRRTVMMDGDEEGLE